MLLGKMWNSEKVTRVMSNRFNVENNTDVLYNSIML